MSEGQVQLSPESLLSHAGFVRALARTLLQDEHRAEDVVQDTWVAALTRKGEVRSLRSWLAGVVRNLVYKVHRSEGRRARREEAVARPIEAPSPAEIVERERQRWRVVDAVLSLRKPYRTTLILRYFEELPPREIARRCDVPVETVRTRHRRGIELVREKLVRDHGGDRRAFAIALLPLAGRPRVAPALAVKACVGAGVAAVVLVSVGTVLLSPEVVVPEPAESPGEAALVAGRDASGPPTDDARAEATRPVEEPAAVEVPERPAPSRGREEIARSTAAGEEPPPPAGVVTGTVSLADDLGPAGVDVKLSRPRSSPFETTTDARGWFSFDGVPAGEWMLRASREEFAPHRLLVTMGEEVGVGPLHVFLSRGGSLLVQVLDAGGGPVPDEAIRLEGHERRSGRTDADGRLLLEHLEAGSYRVHRKGEEDGYRTVTVKPGQRVEVSFRIGCGVEGVALGPEGDPLPSAIVRLIPTEAREEYRSYQTRADEEGAFRIPEVQPGEYRVGVQLVGERAYVVTVGTVTLRPGDIVTRRWQVARTSITGRVVLADREAARERGTVTITAHSVEGPAGEVIGPVPAMAWANGEGRFELPGLSPGYYRIYARSAGWRETSRVVELPPSGILTDVDFLLERRRTGTLRLEVLEPDGTPAAGLSFSYLSDGKHTWTTLHPREVSSGVYEFELDPGRQTVSVSRKGFRAPDVTVSMRIGEVVTRTVELSPDPR
jgi:RNA polymerase sigma-70 factor (ECF subfamily)